MVEGIRGPDYGLTTLAFFDIALVTTKCLFVYQHIIIPPNYQDGQEIMSDGKFTIESNGHHHTLTVKSVDQESGT